MTMQCQGRIHSEWCISSSDYCIVCTVHGARCIDIDCSDEMMCTENNVYCGFWFWFSVILLVRNEMNIHRTQILFVVDADDCMSTVDSCFFLSSLMHTSSPLWSIQFSLFFTHHSSSSLYSHSRMNLVTHTKNGPPFPFLIRRNK